VCVKKISAASKLWKLKKLKEGKIFCAIILLPLIFNGANVVYIFECAKKYTKKL
jgi:hypothetical protein